MPSLCFIEGNAVFGKDRGFIKSENQAMLIPTSCGKRPLVSVIILTCNNKQLVMQCLHSLSHVVYQNLEIIVVDNASADGTSRLILERFPKTKIVRSERNLGYAGGNNLGIKNANGIYLLLLNDDTLVDPHFISRLIEAMEAESRAALGSCKIYMIKGNIIQYAGGFIDEMGYPLMRGCGEEDKGQYDKLDEVDWASGSCMIIRRRCLDEIGSLDDSFYLYYEDTDLSYRARQKGYKVIYIPMAIIRHHGSATTRRHWRYQIFSTRNRFRFLLRHFGRARTAKAIAWDFYHATPRKVPYLFIALLWAYPSLLSTIIKKDTQYNRSEG